MTVHQYVLAIGVAALVLAAGVFGARADVIGPPPTNCPTGTRGSSSHSGPYCAPALCSTDADCTGGASCRDAALCIARQACGGLGFDGGPYPDGGFPPPCQFDTVQGLCEGGAACAMGSCQTRRVCVAAPTSSGGCGCHAGTPTRGLAAILGLGLVALVVLARRRAA